MWYLIGAVLIFVAGDVVEYKYAPLRKLSYWLDNLIHKVVS